MSKELIAALEAIAAIKNKDFGADWEEIEEARFIAERALSRHRSSVESVELPWAECWVDGGDLEQLGKLGMGGVLGWPDNGNDPRRVPLYTASTVRSLIAAAVEREREQCHLIAEAEQLRREAIRYRKGEDHALEGGAASAAEQIAAAIRARGEK